MQQARAQTTLHVARTPVLDLAYEQTGDPGGWPVVLLHGFPYDVRAYDEVVPHLVEHGARVLVPHLRGFGPTRFRSPDTLRSGQQGALGADLRDLLDAAGIERAILGGYDWGGRAACVTAALWPERVAGLVTVGGYNIQDIAASGEPVDPRQEQSYWYQYYLHSDRGRRGLQRHREQLCRLLWTTWSPTWTGAADAFDASAPSLHNPDFVDVVAHSYRHRYRLVDGDPRYDDIEAALALHPAVTVATVVLESGADGVLGPSAAADRARFTGPYGYELLAGVGHDAPQEAPAAFARAVLRLHSED